jgi:hypothetical protein
MTKLLPAPWPLLLHDEAFEIRDASGQSLMFSRFHGLADRADASGRIGRAAAEAFARWVAASPTRTAYRLEDLPNWADLPETPWGFVRDQGAYEILSARGERIGRCPFDDAELEPERRMSREKAFGFARWVICTPERFGLALRARSATASA